jgi:ABC-type branched-subunit amino acid transport system ATPase component/branched-subunit amino acid ABC-type transport system permease component
MLTFFTYVVLGLATGAVYSLTAFGTILVYRGSGVVNFASGALATVGTFVYYDLAEKNHTAWPLAMLAGTAVSGVLGAATYLLIMKPMRKTSALTRTIATLGVFVATNAALVMWEPAEQLSVKSFYPHGSWEPVNGLVLGYDQIIVLAITVFTAVLLSVLWQRTRFGLMTSAVAENQRSASALGISSDTVAAVNWFIGCGLAGLAGILLAPILGLQIATITSLLFPSLVAALVGQMNRFLPALIGGLAVGIGQSVVAGYYPATPGLTTVVPFVFVLGLMLLRGRGIPDRGYIRDRLPLVGSGRVRLLSLLAGAGVIMLLIWGTTENYADAMITTMATAIILLSVVVVTGYAGQISLAQYAMAGLGTFAAGRLVATTKMPVLMGVLIAVVVALLAGLIIGVPALRSRGVSLAVLTLGFAVVLQDAVFGNSSFASLFGDQVGPLQLFGLDLDATLYPRRYATFAAIVFLLLAVFVAKIRRGTLGRRLMAIRGSERAAAALGINVYAAKLFAFSLAAGIAAIGGIVLAFRSPTLVYSSSYGYELSINALVYTVIGGLGYLAGPVLASAAVVPGGLLYEALDFLRQGNDQLLTLIGGFGLILVLWSAPDGMAKQISGSLVMTGRFARRWVADPATRWIEPATRWIRRPSPQRAARAAPAGGVPSNFAGADVTRAGSPAMSAPSPEPERAAIQRVQPQSLTVRNVSVRFGGVLALDDVSIELKPGEVVGLIGPNGAGKTTLIDAITGFVSVAKGTIELSGRRVNGMSVAHRSQIGIGRSFQNLELFEDLTVRENLQIACDPRGIRQYLTDLVLPRRSRLSRRAEEVVRLFDLEDDLSRTVRELPYGRRRLCAIARATAAVPSVLLLDEPAAGLGSVEIAELSRLVIALAREQGVAVLLIEHNIDLIIDVCDRVLVLEFGKEIAHGTPDEIRRNQGVLRAYMGEEVESEEAPQASVVAALAAEDGGSR